MKSRWIVEIVDYINEHDYSAIMDTMDRIDVLLKKAMHNTDDEILYQEIRKEIKDV